MQNGCMEQPAPGQGYGDNGKAVSGLPMSRTIEV